MRTIIKIFIMLFGIIALNTSCNKDDILEEPNDKQKVSYLKSALGGCNEKALENIDFDVAKNDTVIMNLASDTLKMSVGLNYICCAPFITDCTTSNDSIFISISDTCTTAPDCYCRCNCYYTFDYFFKINESKNYYWHILINNPREESAIQFAEGIINIK